MKITSNMYKLYCGDVLSVMHDIADESINLIFSSPPYNLGIKYDSYDDNSPFDNYLIWHEKVLRECYRVLTPDGRMGWQTGATRKDGKYFPLNSWVAETCRKIGFQQRCEIIWNKRQISSRTAWGSWLSPKNNNVLPSYEYIELFHKTQPSLQRDGAIDISKEEFIEWTNGLWTIVPKTKSEHPAPFPEELAIRIIKMNTYIGDMVLDPFNGSGTTGLVAVQLGRDYIGIDISNRYIDITKKRLNEITPMKNGDYF